MDKIYAHIQGQFAARARQWNLKPNTAAYRKEQAAFFSGAMVALWSVYEHKTLPTNQGEAMPPKWYFGLLRGDDLTAEE